MRLQRAVAGWRSLALSTLLVAAGAKKDKPDITSQKFDFVPFNVNYFDDSDVIMMEDVAHHDIYRSQDTGVTWEKVEEPSGKVLELQMHPFDKSRAFIITTETTHYKTKDQGKTWQKFESKLQPTVFRDALAFHAGDPDRIIFNAMDCAGIFCEELVGLRIRIVGAGLMACRLCTRRTDSQTTPRFSVPIPLAATGPSPPSCSRPDRMSWTSTESSV